MGMSHDVAVGIGPRFHVAVGTDRIHRMDADHGPVSSPYVYGASYMYGMTHRMTHNPFVVHGHNYQSVVVVRFGLVGIVRFLARCVTSKNDLHHVYRDVSRGRRVSYDDCHVSGAWALVVAGAGKEVAAGENKRVSRLLGK